ncbi:aminotransferase class IV family protein [Tropicibacter naphthalenivorans]|uniref:Probable branched-chain-amino-acid aminotransferase n=1 Tax=Tropicibacter naphthalenivorans TaxID=441103 RepID=A0A0P1GH23_9RHOB|nr:aminotransferase class IV family protein [Tropicibacter naphthalenivorans]CUH81143.1 4-amino-4-deoxychorismate lyase [Tropicibacter naphthalenivorans]SMC97357.1 4-amino-4-deoxychorismate lyase [Tropicibacter naphthalenivorans]
MEEPFRHVPAGTRLIETMLWQPGVGVALARRHRDRMCLSARRLGFDFDPAGFDAALAGVTGDAPQRLRLTLGAEGLEMTQGTVPPPATLWRVAIAPQRLSARDPWLGVKSTRRALYDSARAALPQGLDEVIFLNEMGQACEGTITNLLVKVDGMWVTPPLSDGVLPGVMRAELLATGQARVASIPAAQLDRAPRLALCNALRGLIPAQLIP